MPTSDPQKPKFAADGKLSAVNRTLSPSETTRQSIAPGTSAALASGFAEEPLPAQFGRYRILKLLGSGNMGQVYLAEDSQLKRTVALKVPWTATLKHPDALARFYREARTAATLHHPNICAMYDVGEIDGRHYLTMAYIPGKPLTHFLDSGKQQPFREIALLFRKLARALHEAHQQGVVHRDLKPANVMLDDRKEPVVMDFGLAHLLNSDEQARLTQTGAILGTPAYMSPEQVRGDRNAIGPASDVYSLGVMLYQFLTGELPFVGTVYSVFGQILTQDPPRPSEIRPDVDSTLESICLKMMARDVDDRYASMFEVGRDLTAYLKGQSVDIVLSVWDELPVLPVKVPAAPKKIQETVELPATPTATPRNYRLMVLLGVMGIMLVVLVIKPLIPIAGEAMVSIQIEDPELSVEFAGRTILAIHTDQAVPVVADRAYAIHVIQDGKVVKSEKFIWKNDAKATLVVTRVNGPITIIPRELLLTLRAATGNYSESRPAQIVASGAVPTRPVPPSALAPFDAAQAKAHQEAWASHLGVEIVEKNVFGMDLVLIPPGIFLMGSQVAEDPPLVGQTQHRVQLTKPFWIGRTEVTQGQWELVMGTTPWKDQFNAVPEGADYAATYVTWWDALQFCQKLSQLDGEPYAYRLPTEAEWEWSCRAGTTSLFSFGDIESNLGMYGWYGGIHGDGNAEIEQYPHRVALKLGNPFGLSDMHGNVSEWCQDWYEVPFYGNGTGMVVDPLNANASIQSYRVQRGGSWDVNAYRTRSAYRGYGPPALRFHHIGFRVARTQ